MNTLALIAILIIPVFAIYWEGAKLTPLVVTAGYITPVLLGYAELDTRYGSSTALLYCLGVYCFVIGYISHQAWKRARGSRDAPSPIRHAKRSAWGLRLFVAVVAGLAFYHFFAAGVPLLSENVETTRFDFTSSGLFGVPGRMFLFGLPFAVFLVSAAATRTSVPVSSKLIYFTWFSYAAVSLLGGFKGGLVAVVTTMLLVRSVSGKPLSLRRMLVGWRVLVIVAAVLYGGSISLRYRSLGLSSPGEVIPYLAARATISAADPGYLVFSRYGVEGTGGEQFAQDANYFATRYLPFLPLDGGVGLPLEKVVSAALSHTVVSDKAFIVPVTVGAFPEMVANFGIAPAALGMLWLGALLSWLATRAFRCVRPLPAACFAFAANFLQIYVLNGDLMYAVFNLTLVSLLLFVIYRICHLPSALLQAQFHGIPDRRPPQDRLRSPAFDPAQTR